jgi:SAM-dependent methyltransferase
MATQSSACPSPEYQNDPGSFRDRNGRVYCSDKDVIRGLSAYALEQWNILSQKPFFQEYLRKGAFVATESADVAGLPADFTKGWAGFLRHERIPFISYPFEWSFSMLKDAALLHLELLDAALQEGMTTKDGSAYNIQWRGVQPVFIDIPSFEATRPGEPWAGYRQFCQLFLFPLMLSSFRNHPVQLWLRGRIEGIEPEECWNAMSIRDLFRKGVFSHVYLHTKLQNMTAHNSHDMNAGLKNAGFHQQLVRINVNKLRRIIKRLQPKQTKSNWSNYATDCSYSEQDREAKERFVGDVVSQRRRRMVWDLGCNTGTFSKIAAKNSDYVVAMDSDRISVERLYLDVQTNGPGNILPLVNNIVDPSPGLGWRLSERRTLHERGRPDLILCLALVHHLVIGSNVPLRELIEWLAHLGSDLVIEFAGRDDPMVQKLLRNKTESYDDYEIAYFEQCLSGFFEIVQKHPLTSGSRTLYHLRAATVL